MPLRKLNDTKVSAIGYGAMGLSGFYGDAVTSDEERFKVIYLIHLILPTQHARTRNAA
jgi:aryl-alcohol dehydrogenase-like predicted oxidoreductase